MAVRNGRFKVDDASQGGGIRIIAGHSGAFYRIFNSGDNDFTIKAAGASTPAQKQLTLAPAFSVDIAIAQSVFISTAAPQPIEGIYEYLTESRPIRSGRFKFRAELDNMGNPVPLAYPHPIIALFDRSELAWYRIFNSGPVPIVMKAPGSSQQITIEENQSFDFEVGNAHRVFTVEATSNVEPIQGMYEFLGRET